MQNFPIDVAVSHNAAIDALFAKFSISVEDFMTDSRAQKNSCATISALERVGRIG